MRSKYEVNFACYKHTEIYKEKEHHSLNNQIQCQDMHSISG